jgi:hypothetical protein
MKKKPEPPTDTTLRLVCHCRSFRFPHYLRAHEQLWNHHDWRTPEEREAGSGDWRAKMRASPVTTSELLILAGESAEHTWNGTRPDGVAFVFEQELVDVAHYRPDGGVALAIQQELVLISGRHPVTPQQAQFCLREFPAPRWAFFGHVFSYTDPHGGTCFRSHPHPALGEKRWQKEVLDLPVFTEDRVHITYQDKILCRLKRVSFEEHLASEGRAQSSPETRKFSGPDAAAAALQFFRDRVAGNPCRCGPASFDGYCHADFPPDELPEMGIFVDMNIFFTDSSGGTRGDPDKFVGLMGMKVPFAMFCGRCLHVFCVCQRQGDRHGRQ